MRYLVTGGCGFIGSHLCDALVARGDDVIILDNLSSGKRENIPEKAKLVVGDITDAKLVAELMKEVDGCFHLAAIASVERSKIEWQYTHTVNQTGTINIFAASAQRKTPVPIVYASSAAVYGDNPDVPLVESETISPLSAYGVDKAACELHARIASSVHNVPTLGLRFFNVYGPRQDPASPYSGVISIFASKISRGEEIAVYGDGEQSRDFIYVRDVANALLASMQRCDRGAYVLNVCTGIITSVNKLAETISRMSGKPLKKRHLAARTGDIRISVGNPDLVTRTLGWKPVSSLDGGLRHTLAALASEQPA